MPEPTTYAGYKVGTLISLIMGASVTAGITPGPLHMRVLAGAIGGVTSFVGTGVFAPITIHVIGALYAWVGLDASAVPVDGAIGITGFVLALVGIDLCRWTIDITKRSLKKIPALWPFPAVWPFRAKKSEPQKGEK